MSGAVEGVALLPCPNPWCYSHARDFPLHQLGIIEWPVVHGRIGYRVRCNDCGLTGTATDKKAEAIAAWNTRTTPPARSYADEDVARIIDPGAWMDHAEFTRKSAEEPGRERANEWLAAAEQSVAKSLAKAAAIRLLSQGGEA